jgi:hypothetical protein
MTTETTLAPPKAGPKPKFDYAEATRRFLAGETLATLAADYGVTRQRMSQVVGPRREKTPEVIAQEQRVVALRLAGRKIKEIAAEEGLGLSQVSMIIQRYRRA